MPYCNTCKQLTVDELDDNDVPLQESLSALKASAEQGCEFCLLCWTRIQQDANERVVSAYLKGEQPSRPHGDDDEDEAWSPKVWLRGQFAQGRASRGAATEEGACLWVSCGKLPSYPGESTPTALGGIYSRLSIYATPESPAATRFRERLSTAERNPELNISMTLEWLRRCHASHKLCSAGAAEEMPTRVIDVGDPKQGQAPRLVVTKGMRERYLALSYCWGPASNFTLNAETKDGMFVSIDVAALAKTHQEVLSFARALGIRYIWIDALCIIQGDVADWEYESKRMASVYGNAALTVIAGRSADARDGFLSAHVPEKAAPCPIPLSASPNSGFAFAGLPRSRKIGPVDTRGWCFQELVLSRRAAIFGEQQLFFQCRTRGDWEDGYMRWGDGKPSFLQPALFSASSGLDARRERTLKQWYEFLQQYLVRELSNPHDVFAAVSSIAQLAGQVLRSRYLAGIWEGDLVRGLLWKPRYHFHLTYGPASIKRPVPSKFAPPPVVRAPSWSWAALQGAIAQNYNERHSTRYLDPNYVKIRPRLANPERWSPDEECGPETLHMPRCELQFLGYLAEAAVLPIPVAEYLPPTKKWARYSKAKMHKHGVLLRPGCTEDDGMLHGVEQVVAIGLFDITGEQCNEVWCLLLVPTEGLMLQRDGDGKFRRVGWFILEKDDWFSQRSLVDVCLI